MLPYFQIKRLKSAQTKRETRLQRSRLVNTANLMAKYKSPSKTTSREKLWSELERGYRVIGYHSIPKVSYGDGWIEEIIENIFLPTSHPSNRADQTIPENGAYRDLLWSVDDGRLERLDVDDLLCLGNDDLQMSIQEYVEYLQDDSERYSMSFFQIESFVKPLRTKVTDSVMRWFMSPTFPVSQDFDIENNLKDLKVFQWSGQWFLIMAENFNTANIEAVAIGDDFIKDLEPLPDDGTEPTSYYGIRLHVTWNSQYVWTINTTEWMANELWGQNCFPLHYDDIQAAYAADLSFGNLDYLSEDLDSSPNSSIEKFITNYEDFWSYPGFHAQLEEMRFNPQRDPKLIVVLEDLVSKGILERVP